MKARTGHFVVAIFTAAALTWTLSLHGEPGTSVPVSASFTRIGEPGQPIDIDRHAVTGKFTIFDFYSANCPPCRAIAPHLKHLTEARKDIVVRTIDVDRPGSRGIDFRSPVARQYELEALPHFIIAGREGRRIAEGEKAYRLVKNWIEAQHQHHSPSESPAGSGSSSGSRRQPHVDEGAGSGGGYREAGS